MKNWLISPPVVFIGILFTLIILTLFLKKLSFRVKKSAAGTRESYACGEENYNNNAQPDYSQFFPFAFFFTLAHVATLMIATVPFSGQGAYVMAAIYIVGAIVGLFILLKK
ncbi:MAG: hypothetical protein NTW13_04060 [Candidatus Omnitrophica bacterium]|nr:hypothetical protein [Candidatus Omnitrophota bacterium]